MKAAEKKWAEKFADKSIKRDEVQAFNDDGEPIGKAVQGLDSKRLCFSNFATCQCQWYLSMLPCYTSGYCQVWRLWIPKAEFQDFKTYEDKKLGFTHHVPDVAKKKLLNCELQTADCSNCSRIVVCLMSKKTLHVPQRRELCNSRLGFADVVDLLLLNSVCSSTSCCCCINMFYCI